MPQDTYRQCFFKAPRQYTLSPDAGDGDVNISKTMVGQDVPAVLVRLPASHYVNKALAFLNTPAATAANSALAALAPSGAFHGLRNEADVKVLAFTHLILPIMVAINLRHGGNLQTYAEMTLPDVLRVDLAIKKRGQDSHEAVVLIEYKHCSAINPTDFDDASCDNVKAAIAKNLKTAQKNEDRTMLGDEDKYHDALKLVKQLTAYVTRSGCRYGALCDYQSLILFRYNFLEEVDLDFDSVRITIVQPTDFLPALLGFLMEAYEDIA